MTLQIKAITKDMEGKVLCFRGNRNLKRRQGETPLDEAKVLKVRPKSVLVEIEGSEVKISHSGNRMPSCNAGYDMYLSQEDAVLEQKADKARSALLNKLMYEQKELDPAKVVEAAELLGLEL